MNKSNLSCIFLEMSELTKYGASSGEPLPPEQVVRYINEVYPGGFGVLAFSNIRIPQHTRCCATSNGWYLTPRRCFATAPLRRSGKGTPGEI